MGEEKRESEHSSDLSVRSGVNSRPSSLIKIMQDGTLKRAELAGLARTLAPSHTPLNTHSARCINYG